MGLRVNDSGKKRSVGRQRGLIALGAERKGEMEHETDKAVVLGLNSMLLTLLASAVPIASKDAAVGTDRAYFSYQLRGEVLAHF